MSMSIATPRAVRIPSVPQGTSTEALGAPTLQPLSSNPVAANTASPLSVQQRLADTENLQNLALRLRGIQNWVDSNFPAWLSKNAVQVKPDSTYGSAGFTLVKLATFITDLGYTLPTTGEEVSALAQALEQKASQHPLGNLGGGRSWPRPMSQEDQQAITRFLSSGKTGIAGYPDVPDSTGRRVYSLTDQPLTKSELRDPQRALQIMLDSPRAEALGHAIQTHLQGVPSDTSVYDYVLTAMLIGLDPESVTAPARNKTAGFDVAGPGQSGYSPQVVFERLRNHLISLGRANADNAALMTHILLSSVAPQFLIKDIPDNLTVGSQAWANLSIATAAIEAKRPGSVANMTFAQVMIEAKGLEAPRHAVEGVLIDWAVANGVLAESADDRYTGKQLDTVRAAFNKQLAERLSASQALDKEIPTRKDIALAKLKERFGDLGALFEAKVLGTDQYRGEPEQVGLGGMHSLLDVAMMDLPNPRPFTSSDPRIPLDALNGDPKFGVQEAFDQQFARAITDKKVAVTTTVQHLIAQLPLEDRKKFDFGKISLFQEGSYTAGLGFTDSTPGAKQPGLLVKVELNGETTAYEINLNQGTIGRTALFRLTKPKEASANTVYTLTPFNPKGEASHLSHERTLNDAPLDSFNSGRSYLIGKLFAEHLELDDPTIKEQARGQTTLDELNGGPKPLSEFLLNVIPFRSAIVNFQQGNIGEGLFDLTLDIFGFLTAGAATAGKLVKIGSSALTTGAKTLKGAHVIGAAAIGVLNPVNGVGDLAVEGAKLLGKGGRYLLSKGTEAVNMLKGATASYDLLKTASKQHTVAATGTYKVAEQTFEGGAVLSNGKWYSYDPVTGRAYGTPLPMFSANSVAMGGVMQKFRVLDNGLGMSEDITKRGLRLTLDAHGVLPAGHDSALMVVNGKQLTPSELLDLLKASNVDVSKYSDIRLTMCNSATGAERSFAAQLSTISHKPTEGFRGVMHTSTEVEDVAARMFKNGGARQREYIEEVVIGQKKTIDKYKLTGMTSDNRAVYTHHPDYNPVRFDAQGKPLIPKPLRTSYENDKVTLGAPDSKKSEVDLSEYDDLT